MATRTSGYCGEGDLLLGDMRLSTAISPAKFINDTADEIDVRLGRLYETPFDVSEPTPLDRVAILTLKLVNARLASGRILMAQAQAAQDDNLHAYAMYLLTEAETALSAIESGRMDLEGATYIGSETLRGPSIANQDEVSLVSAFYGDSPVWRPGVL